MYLYGGGDEISGWKLEVCDLINGRNRNCKWGPLVGSDVNSWIYKADYEKDGVCFGGFSVWPGTWGPYQTNVYDSKGKYMGSRGGKPKYPKTDGPVSQKFPGECLKGITGSGSRYSVGAIQFWHSPLIDKNLLD